MAKIETARQQFEARNREIWNLDAHGVGDESEINARYNYRHGWIMVDGENFSSDACFPDHATYNGD